MTSRSENTVVINQPVDKVHAALTNAGYWTHIAENLSPEPGSLNEFTEADGGAVATLFEVLPLEILPEAVRAMISQALKVKRVYTVGALAANTFSGNYTADVKGTPVDFKGTVVFTGEGETTTVSYSNEISVNIPFMGPAIEPKVGEALGELFTNEGHLTAAWISDNL